MMLHPFILSVLVTDALALLFFIPALQAAVRTAADWSPGSSGRGQILLEASYEKGSLSARVVLVMFSAATLVLIIGITNVFPGIVPGAMCGTGVIQATEGRFLGAVFLRILALAALYSWSVFEKLNRTRPDFPMARLNARVLLLASPFVFLAAYNTLDGLRRLDGQSPVDCCTVVYDQVAGTQAGVQSIVSDESLVYFFVVLTALLIISGVAGLISRGKLFSACAAVLSLVWAPVSAIVLVRTFAAYYYEVLHHHCPWCLFLPEHGFAGYPLFISLGIATVHAPLSCLIFRASERYPDLGPAAVARARRSLCHTIAFALVFTALAAGPALLWRLRFGVWMEY